MKKFGPSLLFIPNLQSVAGSWRSELPRSDAIASIVLLLLATAATWCGPHIRATKIAASTVTVQIAPKWPEEDVGKNSFILLPLILLGCDEVDDGSSSSSSQWPWYLRGTDHIFNIIPVNQSLPKILSALIYVTPAVPWIQSKPNHRQHQRFPIVRSPGTASPQEHRRGFSLWFSSSLWFFTMGKQGTWNLAWRVNSSWWSRLPHPLQVLLRLGVLLWSKQVKSNFL